MNRLLKLSASILVLHLFQIKTYAQSSSDPEIKTDRPTVTPSPYVVPPSYIQAENGLALRKEYRGSSFNVPQTLVRLGILPRTELRLVVPNYFFIRGGQSTISGVADMSLGAKVHLGPLPGKIDLAIIPGFTVPTGSALLTTDAVDPFVQITLARKFFQNWTIGSAQSIFMQTEEAESQAQGISTNKKNVIYQPTMVVFRKIGLKADLFSEYVGNFTKGKLSDQIIDAGVVYRFRRNQQLGMRTGVGFTKVSPTVFIEFGYSFLLGKIFR